MSPIEADLSVIFHWLEESASPNKWHWCETISFNTELGESFIQIRVWIAEEKDRALFYLWWSGLFMMI